MWEKEIGTNQVDRSRKLVDRIRLSLASSRRSLTASGRGADLR